jgi:glycosyltransferase involved in cell wall biosynthesis
MTVVVPVYNGERFLGEALDSVVAQGVSGLEVLVVDDGSTDGTADIARAHPASVSYVWQENRGQAAAVNAGLRRARGELVTVLDSDDVWAAGMLAVLQREMACAPEADIVSGLTSRYRDGRAIGAAYPALFFGSALIRRALFDRVGLQDERLRFSEDADWFLRALEAGAVVRFCPVLALYYREHDGNLTCDKPATLKGYAAVIKRSLDRRRGADGTVRPLTPGTLIVPDGIARNA